MGKSMEVIKAQLDSEGLKYQEVDPGRAVRVGFSHMPNAGAVGVIVFMDEDDASIALRSFNLVTLDDAVKPAMYKVCSDLNAQYRWMKFYVDEKDNTITVAADAVTQLDSVGEETMELVARMVRIIDEAYPTLMRAKFGMGQ